MKDQFEDAAPGKPDSVIAALKDTLTTVHAAPAVSSDVLTITVGTAVSSAVNLAGRTPLRLLVGAAWTAADVTVQVSTDGTTWLDLYDNAAGVYTIKAAASRAVLLKAAELIGVTHLRLRSGTPALPVNQTATATLTLHSQTQ